LSNNVTGVRGAPSYWKHIPLAGTKRSYLASQIQVTVRCFSFLK